MKQLTARIVPRGFWLLVAALLALAPAHSVQLAAAQVSTPTAGEDALYIDPDNRFAIPIPTNWAIVEHDGFVEVVTDDKKISIALAVIPGTGAMSAIEQTMKLLDPDSDATPLPELMATPTSGNDDVALLTYDDASASGQLVQAYGQRVGSSVFVLVLRGDFEAVKLRQVQVDKVRFGVQINPDLAATPVATPGT